MIKWFRERTEIMVNGVNIEEKPIYGLRLLAIYKKDGRYYLMCAEEEEPEVGIA